MEKYYCRKFTSLSQVEKIWQNIEFKSNSNFFQSFFWIKSYLNAELINNEHIKKNIIYIVIFKSKDKEPICLIPLIKKRLLGIWIAEVLGSETLELFNFQIKKEFYKEIIESNLIFIILAKNIKINLILFRNITYLSKNSISKNSINIFKLSDKFGFKTKEYSSSEIFNKELSKRLIKDIKRSERNLQKSGNLNHIIIQNDSLKMRKILKDIINIKSAQLQKKACKNPLMHSKLLKYYSNLFIFCEDKEAEKFKYKAQLDLLNLDNKILAASLSISYKKNFYYLIPVIFDSEFKKYSPGRILLNMTIKKAIDIGNKNINFLIGEENYKERFNGIKYPTYDMAVSFSNRGKFLGRIIQIYRQIISRIKHFKLLQKILIKFYSFL
tara:strand:+ start:6783 stop:7931 length:1149 start_codon:yes stop_codon:yes gene_type:complete